MTIINEKCYITEYNEDGSYKGLRLATEQEINAHFANRNKASSYWENDHS